MNLEIGQVLLLNDDKEYMIWKIVESYVCLMTMEKPIRIVITQYGNHEFKVIQDKNKIQELLTN